MTRVLVVAAHPDDEILGAGATLAQHVQNGDEVHAVVVSEGASARYAEGAEAELVGAARRSAETLGLASITFLGLPDQRLDGVPLLEVTQSLEPIVQGIEPSTVYTHTPVDVNTDHGVVARACWTACRPYSAPWVKTMLAFETPSSTEWAWPLPGHDFSPQWFVDVSETLDLKLRAMACYESELRDYPHPRSLRALEERARYWGSRLGVAAAEPFVVLRARR